MELFFGLGSLAVTGVTETYEAVRCDVEAQEDRPACVECGSSHPPKLHGSKLVEVRDTPSRGKQTILSIKLRRFRCRCGATFQDMPADLHESYPATKRLIRYVEGQVFKRPMSHIAAEVGLSPKIVRSLATSMASRLHEHHRFATPEVLGIDDLRIKKKLYTVITDGRTGHAFGLVEGGKELNIRRELHRRKIDPAAVKYVVSDLGGSNLAVVRELFKAPTLHVADKWHVLKGVQEALSVIINQEIDRLRKERVAAEKAGEVALAANLQDEVDTLRSSKKSIMGGRIKQTVGSQLELDVKQLVIRPILTRHPRIGRAFWAKIRLHMAYASPDRRAAIAHGLRFRKRALHPSIAAEMKIIRKRLWKNVRVILNYFDALAPNAKGVMVGPTTGPAERRNGSIRAIWRSGRGIKNHQILSMRALYEPWDLDVDIAMCGAAGCMAVDGPFGQSTAARRHGAVDLHTSHRCTAHPEP